MWEAKTGYCPVHDQYVTVKVKYSEMRVIGTKMVQRKITADKCDIWDPSRSECSNCPIAYGSSAGTP